MSWSGCLRPLNLRLPARAAFTDLIQVRYGSWVFQANWACPAWKPAVIRAGRVDPGRVRGIASLAAIDTLDRSRPGEFDLELTAVTRGGIMSERIIPRDQVNDLGIIYSVWLDPAVMKAEPLDHKALFDVHREATLKVIRKALNHEPSIDWLLENQDKVEHYYHKLGVDGEL